MTLRTHNFVYLSLVGNSSRFADGARRTCASLLHEYKRTPTSVVISILSLVVDSYTLL